MSAITLNAALESEIVRAAAVILKETVGENIQRIATTVVERVDGVSVADAVRVIDRHWSTVTADAGKGPLSVTMFSGSASANRLIDPNDTAAGDLVADAKTVREALSADEINAAGTLEARTHDKGDDAFVVQGPQYWELMRHTKPFEQSMIGRIFDHALTFLHLDGLREKLAYEITRTYIDRAWSTGEKKEALRGISGSEVEAFTRPGRNGEPAPLQPGDALLCGGGGDGGLTHCILYAGPAPANHPDAGQPMIIHALATLKEGESREEWIADKLRKIEHNLGYDVGVSDQRFDNRTGVLYERLGDFFNRYHRDSIMILRDPTITEPAQIAKGLDACLRMTGYDAATGTIDAATRVPYDYKLAPDDLVTLPQPGEPYGRRQYLAKYCTEIYLAFNYEAHDRQRDQLPYVGTAHYNESSPLGTFGVHQTFIAEPEDLAVSPDFTRVLVAGGGGHALVEAERLRLQAPIAALPRASRPIPQTIAPDD